MLEEAVQLVEIAVGRRQEGARLELAAGDPFDPLELDLQLVAKARNATGDRDQLTAREATAVQVGIAEDAGWQRAAAIA